MGLLKSKSKLPKGGGRGFHQRGVTAMKVHITMFISDPSITLWDEKDGDGVTER